MDSGSEKLPLPDVDAFILAEIDTVPHLEALLLFWTSRPRTWTCDEMAAAIYVQGGAVRNICADLTRRHLIVAQQNGDHFYYVPSPQLNTLLEALELAYKRDLIRITRMIHSKAAPAVREFANAFRFRKDR